jgi:thiamine-phosphate pyrophosphorylase
MAKPQQADVKGSAPRLYLATPLIEEPGQFAGVLGQVIEAADVAAVLLRLRPSDERTLINRVKALALAVQPKDVALILDGHAEIVARAGADGAHLTGIEAFTAALDLLKPARIAGCGGLKTRHDAMLAAERGADYVMFGENGADGRRPTFEAILERVEWWAALFEVPCVAFAEGMSDIMPLKAAGADFIAVGDAVWDHPRGPEAALAEAAHLLANPEIVK